MNTRNIAGMAGIGVMLIAVFAGSAVAAGSGSYPGYIFKANNFVGTYAQWCYQSGYGNNATCGATYGYDKLVMKWNNQWNNCNSNGYNNATYCAGAWVDNEINGRVANGDGTVWHYKIIWVGSSANQSSYWLPGGYSIWGNYEVIMDQGSYSNYTHIFNALATPNGYK